MPAEDRSDEFEALLQYLKRTRGFDFTGYKRTTLNRRIEKRLQAVQLESFAAYIDYLEVHPEEFAILFDTVLINVTGFFRDPETWHALQHDVLPKLLERRSRASAIRVWSAGSASGEEAYSAAMVFAELLGLEAFRARVKIYATDVDDDALNKARQALYSDRDLEGVPASLRERYFERMTVGHCFRKDLRRQVIFGRHDLIQDAPISRVDLLICRNTLMYFNAETQAKILARFHFAMSDGGVLFLGRAETLLSYSNLFTPLDQKRRISMKVGGTRDPLIAHAEPSDHAIRNTANQRAKESAFEASPVGQIVVDPGNVLILANERARTLFGLSQDDLGSPLQDLSISYRPVDLRSRLEQLYTDRRPLTLPGIEWRAGEGQRAWFDVQLSPLVDATGKLLGASVSFTDVSPAQQLREDLERANQALEAAYEELQSTNEELETTNEELQSTVEELETTNEELQSSNEELETMNEELHSTNEELHTMNDEMRLRGDELNALNTLMGAILRSVRGGVVVVDRNLEIMLWNAKAEDLWGLRREEAVGRHFFSLDIGLPLEELRQPLRSAVNNAEFTADTEVSAVNRRGRMITCRVSTRPLVADAGSVQGAIMTMEALDGHPSEHPH